MQRTRVNVLGVAIDQISFEDAVQTIERFADSRDLHYVCVNSVQDIMIAQSNDSFRHIVNRADLATPDGWPVVWALRAEGHRQETRVTGPDLMLALCDRSAPERSHFFYGGAEGVPQRLAQVLKERNPDLRVAGTYSPPFRPLEPEEDRRVIEVLNRSGAHFLWVGLGTPKQHFWIQEHLGRVEIPVMLGVGAAFDFHSGRIRRAPRWMQDHGLEWLHRMFQEPGRLGRRYLRYLPAYAALLAAQRLKLRRYSIEGCKQTHGGTPDVTTRRVS